MLKLNFQHRQGPNRYIKNYQELTFLNTRVIVPIQNCNNIIFGKFSNFNKVQWSYFYIHMSGAEE